MRHRHDERADGRTEHRAVASGERRTTDDRSDDVVEFEAVARVGLDGIELEREQQAEHPGGERHEHEELGLGPGGGHTHLTGGLGIAADREGPAPEAGTPQDPHHHAAEPDEPDDADVVGREPRRILEIVVGLDRKEDPHRDRGDDEQPADEDRPPGRAIGFVVDEAS